MSILSYERVGRPAEGGVQASDARPTSRAGLHDAPQIASCGSGSTDASYYPYFDYLRITLALGVYCSHARDALGAFGASLPHQLGNACVHVFFALSGFLIAGILVRQQAIDLPKFYFFRVTRIWVPYFLAAGLLALGCLLAQQPATPKLFETFIYKITFVYNLFGLRQLEQSSRLMPLEGAGNHFWSICVEEQFYLVAPLILLFCRRARGPLLLLIWLVNFVWPHNFAAIALGALLALYHNRLADWLARPWVRAGILGVSGLAILGWGLSCLAYSSAVPITSAGIVVLLAHKGRGTRVGQFLGGISYPFYLNHWLALKLIKPLRTELGMPHLACFLVALALALLLSSALYVVVDRRILAHRSCWYTRKRGQLCWLAAVAITLVGLFCGFSYLVGMSPGATP